MFRTPAFEDFIAPARHYPEIWRILLGVVVAVIVYLTPILLIFIGIGLFFPALVFEVQSALQTPDTPRAMLVLLATFFFMGLGAVMAAAIHRRGLASLIGPFRPACRSFSRTVLRVGAIFLVTGFIVSLFIAEDPTPHLPLTKWLSYLPLALPLLLVQTGAEELLFRGYLMQALAARFKSAIILVAADLTRITGNLGAAIGFHFTNNFFALFLVSVQGEMSGLSLYTAPFTMQDVETLIPLILVDMATVLLAWAVLRRQLSPA